MAAIPKRVQAVLGQQRPITKPINNLFAPVRLDFSTNTEYLLDIAGIQGNLPDFPVLGVFIDNSNNPGQLSITTAAPVSETFTIPAQAVARLPIESGTPVTFDVKVGAAFSGTVQIIFLNYAPDPIIWFPLGPQTSFATRPAQAIPLGYQQIVGAAAATGLTVPSGATCAVVSVEAQSVRYRDDGTNPTAAVGMPILPGQTVTFNEALSAIKFIEQAASTTLNVNYYKFA